MVDLVFAVEDAALWHSKNMAQFPAHYSWLARVCGPTVVGKLTTQVGAKVWYNTMITLPDDTYIKYGVMETKDLVRDLETWETLYIAGRLQKPVQILTPVSRKLQTALETNLENALVTSLHLLPSKPSEKQIFTQICGLSYLGDFRVGIAEDPGKVDKIVSNNLEGFQALYGGFLTKYAAKNSFQHYSLPVSPSKETIGGVVRKPAFVQAMKGVFSAGFKKTFVYSLRKVLKRIK